MPTVVAAESFQAHERFIARLRPELARPFEARLVLPTGQFHRALPELLPILRVGSPSSFTRFTCKTVQPHPRL